MLNEQTHRDLLLTLEHIEEVNAYFSEVASPEDFVTTKQGRAY